MERIIFKDDSILKDYSVELNCFNQKTALFDFEKNKDALFIGSDLPFNNKYLKIATANSINAFMNIFYWTGTAWESTVDIIDETSGLTQSGHISFTFPRNFSSWAKDDSDNIDGLETLNIFNLYWIKIIFSETLTNTTSLFYIGQKFSEDEDLYSFYPELSSANVKAQFAAGKTNWNEQHFLAADTICRDLINKGILRHKNQILDWRIFTEASIHKVAEIIFLAFGDDFENNRKLAREYYNEALKNVINRIDLNNNAILDSEEKIIKTGFLVR